MAGTPCTVATTRQMPSPFSGRPAGDASRAGMMGSIPARLPWSSWPELRFPTAALGPVRVNDGLPPLLGGW